LNFNQFRVGLYNFFGAQNLHTSLEFTASKNSQDQDPNESFASQKSKLLEEWAKSFEIKAASIFGSIPIAASIVHNFG